MSQNGETKVLWLETHGGTETRRVLSMGTDSQRQALHRLLARMSDADTQKLTGALEIEPLDNIADILTAITDLDHFEFYPGVSSERELGVYLVESGVMHFPDSALPYLDYQKIGTEFRANHSGTFTASGYVVRKDEVQGQMQDADRPQIFRVQLYAPQGTYVMTSPYALTLPASPERLETVKLLLGVTDFSEAHIVRIECPITTLQRCIDQSQPGVELLNKAALEIERIQASGKQLIDLCAMLQAEAAETLEQALEVIRSYDDYEVLRHGENSPADYAKHFLYHTKHADDFDFKDEVREFIDYEGYGREKMAENGVRQTDFGLVRCLAEPFDDCEFSMRMQ